MTDNHYPTVTVAFLKEVIEDCGKIQYTETIGKTTLFIIEGSSYIGKRTINIVGNDDDEIDFMYATSVAIRLSCMDKLLKWLEDNKNWKDGGYFEPQE
jgi:hypothetical protein